jgi:hypothetical protein
VVEDGRREEVFISIGDVAKIYAPLSADRRAYFDELGLSAQPAAGPEASPPSSPPPVESAPKAPERREKRDSPVPLPRAQSDYVETIDLESYDDEDEITKRSSTTDSDGLLQAFVKPHDDD